jgi:RimJ/RimL family protein N-acetyltransferase
LSPRSIEFPVVGISDGVIRLRLLTDADLQAVVDAVQDPEISRWTKVPAPYGESEARQWQRASSTGLAAGTDLTAVVVGAEDDRLMGAVALHNLDPESGRCSAGYWVAAPERGRGVASTALRLLCDYAFAELKVNRIELWIDPDNAASQSVAERSGFTREGLLRSFRTVGDVSRDMLMYSLLPGDVQQ